MRLFLALNFPAELRRAIGEATAPLRAAASAAVSWTPAEKLHLTLKFLGEQPDEMAERVRAALASGAARHAPLRVELGGIGAFPTFRRARVVWLGVVPDPALEFLHHDVEEACAALGFELEGRAFRPHLTLGRVRPSATEGDRRALAAAARGLRYRGGCLVSTIDLMRSTLLPEGARHELLASIPLGRG